MTVTLNPLYRFDTFVVGAANRLAVTAAKAVAESPGTVYNPLFIYARPGLGKTHLLMAIGHAARAINPRLAVEYLTLDEFVEAFHAAIAAGHGEAYRKRFLDVDLLLVDDVQFLTHRREMQAELLRLTDALQTANRQIVLTSDRPPAEIEALDERLIRRFAGGLIIDVAAPDYETRVAILRRKAEERRASFADGVLEAVAGLDIDNVRELLGALNRLIAFQAVSEQPLGRRPGPHAGRRATGRRDGRRIGAPRGVSRPTPRRRRARAGAAVTAVRRPRRTSSTTSSRRSPPRSPSRWTPGATQVGAAVLRWQGEGFRTAQLEPLLGAGDGARSRARRSASSRRTSSGSSDMQAEAAALAPELAGLAGVPRSGRPRRGRGGAPAGARGGRRHRRRPRRSGGWPTSSRPPANRVVLEAARAVVAEPGRPLQPARARRRGAARRQDPPAPRRRQRARRARRARWRASARPSSPAS